MIDATTQSTRFAACRTSRLAVSSAWAWPMILIALALFGGFQQLFSTFAIYDDEGYVMMSLRQYTQGAPLYDDVYTQYGPAYYGLQWCANLAGQVPITHDVTRAKTLLAWLAVSLLAGWFTWRVTASKVVGWLTFGMVFLHLDKLCLEPGHPQELVALSVAGVLAASVGLDRPSHRVRCLSASVIGGLVAIVLLTKLNVGVMLFLGVSAAVASGFGHSSLRRLALVATGWLAASLPLVLYRHHLLDLQSVGLPVVTFCAAVALHRRWLFPMAGSWSDEPQPPDALTWRVLGWGLLGGLTTVVVVLGVTRAGGTSWTGLATGIVGQHLAFGTRFYHPPGLLPVASLWAVAWLVYDWRTRADSRAPLPERPLNRGPVQCKSCGPAGLRFGQVAAGLLVLSSLLFYFLDSSTPLVHGLQPRSNTQWLMALAPACLVFLAGPPMTADPMWERTRNCRALLAGVALLQPLAAFPTPGTQTVVGTFPLLIACVILAHDGLRGVAAARDGRRRAGTHTLVTGWRTAVVCGGAMTLVLGWRAMWFTEYRSGRVPLDLPGCRLLRLDAARVGEIRWLVQTLREHADTFVCGEHGHNSLYFWTELEPPTGLNATFWPFLLRDDQQRRIVAALLDSPRSCVVHERYGAELPEGPLREYLAAAYQPGWSYGPYVVGSTSHEVPTRPVRQHVPPEP